MLGRLYVPGAGRRNVAVSVSLPTVRRLPLYLAVLQKGQAEDGSHMSSSQLAGVLGLEAIQVRKDLEAVGIPGQPRVGFPVRKAVAAIEKFLGWDNVTDAFIIGAGHLGTALAGYGGFRRYGLNVIALFDDDPGKIGLRIHGREVLSIAKFRNLTARMHVHIAILAVPEASAAAVAELAIDAGIKAIWNFTPAKLSVSQDVIVERVDLAASLAVLSSKLVTQVRRTGTPVTR